MAAGAGAHPGAEPSARIPAAEQAVCDREDPARRPGGDPAQAGQRGAVRAGLYTDCGDHSGV